MIGAGQLGHPHRHLSEPLSRSFVARLDDVLVHIDVQFLLVGPALDNEEADAAKDRDATEDAADDCAGVVGAAVFILHGGGKGVVLRGGDGVVLRAEVGGRLRFHKGGGFHKTDTAVPFVPNSRGFPQNVIGRGTRSGVFQAGVDFKFGT